VSRDGERAHSPLSNHEDMLVGHQTEPGLADLSPRLQPPWEADGWLTLGLGTVRAQVKDFLQELHTLKKGQAARLSRKNEQVSCLRML
jgi:hypothetical protein